MTQSVLPKEMTGNDTQIVLTKVCSRCRKDKPLSEFKKRTDGKSKDGLTWYCRDCIKEYHREYSREYRKREYVKTARRAMRQTEHYRAKAREYHFNAHSRRLEYSREYNRSEAGIASQARYKEKNANKIIARMKLNEAIDRGDIIRPEICEECGKNHKTHGHHYLGYSEEHWYDVMWLCRICHGKQHRLEVNNE